MTVHRALIASFLTLVLGCVAAVGLYAKLRVDCYRFTNGDFDLESFLIACSSKDPWEWWPIGCRSGPSQILWPLESAVACAYRDSNRAVLVRSDPTQSSPLHQLVLTLTGCRSDIHPHDCTNTALNAIDWLLVNGADINAVEWRKWTPLHIAVSSANEEVFGLLLNRGANPCFRPPFPDALNAIEFIDWYLHTLPKKDFPEVEVLYHRMHEMGTARLPTSGCS